jgi:hypothetical protein
MLCTLLINLRELFCSARLVVEPLSGCGGSCPSATACSAAIARPPSEGAVAVDPGGVAPIRRSSVHRGARRSRAGRASWGPQGVFDGFIWPDDGPTTVVRASASASAGESFLPFRPAPVLGFLGPSGKLVATAPLDHKIL